MTMTLQEKARDVLAEAQGLASRVESWTEFSNRLFDQEQGLIAKRFGRNTERRAFYDTPEYAEVSRIFMEVIKKFGVSKGATGEKSGKFVLRMPKSLHAALDVEAKEEGVSLNQLAITKLSVSLADSTDSVIGGIVEAFRKVHDGYSQDRVVIDQILNDAFLKECREIGLQQSDYFLNHALFDVRKSGKAILPPTTKRPIIKDYDRFEFGSEIACRYLQRRDGVSLDRILCDPLLRSEFDKIAARLISDVSTLKFRAGALNLRKSRRLRPTDAKAPVYELHSAGAVLGIDLSKLPTDPAAYVFYHDERPLFAGETANLRERILSHLNSSESRGLPDWIDSPIDNLALKVAVVPKARQTDRLVWLRNFINREKPLLNYQKAA
jgi:HicB-like protein involved in pilus formation